jgi:hypothetical protein
MIKSIASSTDLAGFEQMSVTGNATPELVISCLVVREDLSAADQITYDEAIALFSPDIYTEITNTIANLSISRITSQVLVEDTEDVDFDLLTEVDKDKLRALLAIFVTLNELPAEV